MISVILPLASVVPEFPFRIPREGERRPSRACPDRDEGDEGT